ncbi:hypothetical protein HPB49_012808 [Dermacentor silvarum]|uniref:Uncharacterized protein n=1 Tax=Dermacentor silvarum TaxID=543639 RepID=A0ACB8DZT9_DERSI|nr:solute carrier family 22 member 7 [Dermacentor silvarum]KAH7980042.1 hypothetical protein HPB49_012808 [Dermacentor silvarum]
MRSATVALPPPSRPSTLAGDPPNVPEASGSGSASRQQEPAVPFGEGRYQLLALCNAVLAGAAFLIHLFSVRLTAHVMDHWCRPTEAFANMTAESWKEMAIPVLENGTRSHCTRREPPDGGLSAATVPCEAWEFDMSEYGDNIVSEWQLVCQRQWLLELSLYTNFVASVVWVPMMGVAADRVGRRIVVYVSIPALLITGFTSSLTGSFQFLVALRTVASATIVSVATVTFSVLHEVVPANRRTVYCFAALALGQVMAAIPFTIFAALKLSWKIVYLVVMIPTSLLVITLYTMDESYLWLLANWRTKEAERLAMRAARINGVPPETCHTAMTQGNRNGDAEIAAGRRPDSIFSAKLRHHTLLISSIWAAVNFAYSQANLTDIFPVRPGAAFVGVLLLGPVHAVLCPAIRFAGLRRVIVGSALIFSLIALCLATTYRIQTPLSGSIVVVGLRLMGNLNASLAFFLAVDSYPTTARCTGLAFAISVGRLAGSCGEIMFHFAPGQRKDYPIAAMTIMMATVAVAAEHLPEVVFSAPSSVNPAAPSQKSSVTVSLVRTMQDTLDPMARRPVGRARGRRALRSLKRDSDGEQPGQTEQPRLHIPFFLKGTAGQSSRRSSAGPSTSATLAHSLRISACSGDIKQGTS